jgi:hypothetical protein
MNKNDYEKFNNFCHKMSEINNEKLDFMDIENLVKKLHRYETTLHRLAEKDCNYGLSSKDDRKERSTWQNVRKVIHQISPEIIVRENGDPRGCIIELHLPDKTHNYADGISWRLIW